VGAARVQPANYLAELGADAQSKIYEKSSVDLAMKDASRKTRHFLMTTNDHEGLSEDEAISLMSVAVDFGITRGRRQLGRARHREEEPVRGERLTPHRPLMR
jgi:acetamidase/formamidase